MVAMVTVIVVVIVIIIVIIIKKAIKTVTGVDRAVRSLPLTYISAVYTASRGSWVGAVPDTQYSLP